MLVFLSLLEWKPLVKMKMVVDFFIGNQSVGHTFLFTPGEFYVGAS